MDVLQQLRVCLHERALADCVHGSVKQLLDAMAGDGPESAGIVAITRSVAASDVDPEGLFIATVRFLQFIGGSMFATTLSPMLARWARQAWRNAIENQRFHLRAPGVTVPTIEAALNAAGEDLNSVVHIVLAVEPAVRQRLSPELRAQLQTMV